MPDVIVKISACAGVSVRVEQHLDANGRQVLHVSIDEAPSLAAAVASVEEQIAASIRAGGRASEEERNKVYGIDRNSRSESARDMIETSGREAMPSILSRSDAASIDPSAAHAVTTAPIASTKKPTLSSRDFWMARKVASISKSFIRRLLVGKQHSKPTSNDSSGADDSGRVDNA